MLVVPGVVRPALRVRYHRGDGASAPAGAYDDYLDRIDRFCAELKASALAPGFDEILLPGELEHRRATARLAHGIDLDRETVEVLRDLAAGRDVPFALAAM